MSSDCVFRHELSTEADCIFHHVQLLTRMTNDHCAECVPDSVQDLTTQSSLLTMTGSVPSTLHSYRNTDIHNGLHVVEAWTAVGQIVCKDESTSITLIAHCLARYISTLNVKHRSHVQSLLLSDTISWISKLFR